MTDWQTCVGDCQPIKTRAILVWFAWLHKMAEEGLVWSTCNLKLEKKSKLETFWRPRKLLNEPVVRAKRGISVDIQFCPDRHLCISPLLSVTFLVINLIRPRHKRQLYVSATALRRPYCKLALLSFTCEGTSLPAFWSLPTRVCQLEFAVWRPLN